MPTINTYKADIIISALFLVNVGIGNVSVIGEIVGLPYYGNSIFCFYNTFFDNPKESVAKKVL